LRGPFGAQAELGQSGAIGQAAQSVLAIEFARTLGADMGPSRLPHLATGRPANQEDFLLARRHRLAKPWLPERGGCLLDLGCGNGAQTLLFAPRFSRTLGIDIASQFLHELLRSAREHDLSLLALRYGGLALPVRDCTVDVALSFEVLEHVSDEALTLRELYRVLRPGARLILSVPNRWWIFETHGASLPLLPWNRVPLFSWLPKRLHDRFAHARIYRRREILGKLRQAGFEIESSSYVTAPMDVLRLRPLQRLLRATIFRPDRTRLPWLATSVLVIASRPLAARSARFATARAVAPAAPTAADETP
jgi:SAM-dependent methyltransferase